MTLPVRLTPAAARDVTLAQGWYLDEAPHVLASFEEELDGALRRISERPESYQILEPSVRRALVRKFPFSVYLPRPRGVDRGHGRPAPVERSEDLAAASLSLERTPDKRDAARRGTQLHAARMTAYEAVRRAARCRFQSACRRIQNWGEVSSSPDSRRAVSAVMRRSPRTTSPQW